MKPAFVRFLKFRKIVSIKWFHYISQTIFFFSENMASASWRKIHSFYFGSIQLRKIKRLRNNETI